jgi:hypothetical protein
VSTEIRWTEAALVQALRSRFGGPDYALITQVRDGSGWDRRTFDALAIGLWASRGHTIHGFECKIGRGDWRRELAQPQKAEPLAASCHYWWIVAPPRIVDPETLPETWGLLVPDGPNGPIRMLREAARRTPDTLTPGFVAQLAKRLLVERPGQSELDAAEQRGYMRGKSDGDARRDMDLVIAKRHASDAEDRIRAFEERSGVSLTDGLGPESVARVAATVRLVLAATDDSWQGPVRRLHQAREAATRFIEAVDGIGESAP